MLMRYLNMYYKTYWNFELNAMNHNMRFRGKKGPKVAFKKIKQNYKVFGTSLRVQTKLFFEHSTLHGVRYIAENGRPILEKWLSCKLFYILWNCFFFRLLWFVCVCVGTIATTIIILSLWGKFQKNPTITGLDTDFHNWEVPFPSITVCQEFPENLLFISEQARRFLN